MVKACPAKSKSVLTNSKVNHVPVISQGKGQESERFKKETSIQTNRDKVARKNDKSGIWIGLDTSETSLK